MDQEFGVDSAVEQSLRQAMAHQQIFTSFVTNGFVDAQLVVHYQCELSSWVRYLKSLDKTLLPPGQSIIQPLHNRGKVVAGFGQLEGDATLKDALVKLDDFFFGRDTKCPCANPSGFLTRMMEFHDSFDDFRSLILYFDYMQFAFDPFQLVPKPETAEEKAAHFRMVGCIHSVVQYARWLTDVDIMHDITRTHNNRVLKLIETQDWTDVDGPDPNSDELSATRALLQCIIELKKSNRSKSKELWAKCKEHQIVVLDKLEELCKQDNDNVSCDESTFLDYGKQMVNISNYVNRLFSEADQHNHWTAGNQLRGLMPWQLMSSKDMWKCAKEKFDVVATARGIALD